MKILELDFKVNEDQQGDPFDPTNNNQLTTDNISGYIAYMTIIYQSRKYKDDNLQQMFYEDFKGFTMEIFAQAYC